MQPGGLRLSHPLSAAIVLLLVLAFSHHGFAADKFTVGTFNLENYIVTPSLTRPTKSTDSRAKVHETLVALNADVLGLQEIGGMPALDELRSALKGAHVDYPYFELITGADTNTQIAVLSKFPLIARRPHTNEGFLLYGRRHRVSRGIAEVDVQVNSNYTFTLFVAHLKSKRPVPDGDEADLREQEGLILREKIDNRLQSDPSANVVVVGDLNDVKDAKSTRAVLGKARSALVDTRPAEDNGDRAANPHSSLPGRQVTWTHFFGKEDAYTRIDYILLSAGMAREWDQSGTRILVQSNWGLASDHRPIVARFQAQDR